jgi:hypothetical protein
MSAVSTYAVCLQLPHTSGGYAFQLQPEGALSNGENSHLTDHTV